MLAQALGEDEKTQENIYYVALLHDIGKIGVPNAIINKPGKLTDEEYEIIKTHPVIGSDILKTISSMPEISIGARSHHERYDGRGYPDGLAGEDIPWIARIIGVADAYDAMTSNRSYRQYLPQEVVRSEIVKCRGIQFDPRVADAMLSLIDEDKEYKMHE
jgi:HD-GYP domain-containing protein (c-di-GMP phosphodiesterase class II)